MYYSKAPYKPGQKTKYALSRSKIELFMQCQRCFWLETRKLISRPSGPRFNINNAIDQLLKNEFMEYRLAQKAHPIMTKNKLKAIPFNHPQLAVWQDAFKGIRYLVPELNLEVFGGIDDLWIDDQAKLIIVDYKATAKDREVNIDSDWQISYKRQVEIYKWLFEKNDFKVSDTAYFVYANVDPKQLSFNNNLQFTTKLIPYKTNTAWLAETLVDIKKVLESNTMPEVGESIMGGDCEYCIYTKSRTKLTLDALGI